MTKIKKYDDIQWFGVNQLPKNTIPYIKKVIQELSDKSHFSEYGW